MLKLPSRRGTKARLSAPSCRRHGPSPAARCGVTLIELLVVMATIGILVSLTLPAVNSAREAARRVNCSSNLHQIGLALRIHHEHEGRFPVGGVEWRPAGNTTRRQLAWSAYILPYLEQQTLYDQLDLTTPFDSERNRAAAATILSVYLCPTSARGAQRVDGRGPCDYGGIFGERISSPNQPPKGILVYDRAFSDTDVRDGLSHTLIVAEDTGWADGQWINGRNVFDQAFAVNAAPKFENDIRSHHPGGAQAITADGAVHFLGEDLDLRVLAAICTRAGQEMNGVIP